MSLEFYRVAHILGLLMVFSGLAGLWGVHVQASGPPKKSVRVGLALLHGIGMLLLLVSGFGQLARLGLTDGLPSWVIRKLAIWFLLGVSMVMAKRKAHLGLWIVLVWILFGSLAAFLGIFKPV